MEEMTTEQIAASDPFGSRGVFLPCALDGQEILDSLERVFGETVPAVVWPGRGAWVQSDGTAEHAALLFARWGNR
jgi:hypothetical protein